MDYSEMLYVYWKSPLYIENMDDTTTQPIAKNKHTPYIFLYNFHFGDKDVVILLLVIDCQCCNVGNEISEPSSNPGC